jgi:hypothetical protein
MTHVSKFHVPCTSPIQQCATVPNRAVHAAELRRPAPVPQARLNSPSLLHATHLQPTFAASLEVGHDQSRAVRPPAAVAAPTRRTPHADAPRPPSGLAAAALVRLRRHARERCGQLLCQHGLLPGAEPAALPPPSCLACNQGLERSLTATPTCPRSLTVLLLRPPPAPQHRAAINHLQYTPDGRRLLCGANNGGVSLLRGTTFENEMGINVQFHEASPIRCMAFSHSAQYLLSCDDLGRVKLSKPTLEVLHVRARPGRSESRAGVWKEPERSWQGGEGEGLPPARRTPFAARPRLRTGVPRAQGAVPRRELRAHRLQVRHG